MKASQFIKPDCNFEQQMTLMNQTLNTDHAMIGGMVAKSWKLPNVVTDAISKQRDTLSVDGLTGILINLLHAAILLHDNKFFEKEFEPILVYMINRLKIEETAIESLSISN